MAKILKGKEVADALSEKIQQRIEQLQAQNIFPTLAIIRVGEKPEDLSYERGALKRAEKTGVQVRCYQYEETVSQSRMENEIERICKDPEIHGVLLFRPLPEQIDEAKICRLLDPAKDIDGITEGSLAGVFMATKQGFPPCTARACMEILEHYEIPVRGKRVAVLGRSLVIGKPVAMMMMAADGTVTVCHSKTGLDQMQEICRKADIVIAAMGKAKMIDDSFFSKGQTVLDVGINVDTQGNLCGDVDTEQVQASAGCITPVPGGVGAVTTAVLMLQTVEAAEMAAAAGKGDC